MMSEKEATNRDAPGFEALAMPLLDGLYRFARTLAGQEPDAQDLVQATYLKAMERFDSFEPGSNCRAWMMRIMRNTWIDQLRRRKMAGPTLALEEELLYAPQESADPSGPSSPSDPSEPSALANMLDRFSDEEVIHALLELPQTQRAALFLADVDGLDQREVADVMDLPVGTVKSRVSRARAVLREKLEAHAHDMGFLRRVS
jgi:RNA polymerase sigma-70 factor (ECF subfamily)